MAFIHGKNTVVKLNSVDLSAYVKSSEFTRSADSHDITHYGDDAKGYAPGLTDATFKMEGTYSDAVAGPSATIRPLIGAAAVTLIRQPEGTGSGLPQDSVSVIVTDYTETNPVDGMVAWSCECQCSGDVTITDQA